MTSRIETLARPKTNLLMFPDRRSVYWLDELPTTRTKWSTTAFELSPRLEGLAKSKQANRFYEDDSRPVEWPVSAAALKARCSQRICFLAQPQTPVDGWQPQRPLVHTLSAAVKTCKPRLRIQQLVEPKRRLFTASSEGSSAQTIVLTPSPSARLLRLASPKVLHSQHAPARPVSWPVSTHVLNAVASERVQTLARPKSRQALYEGYDASRISPAARAATASPRLRELALPLPRKCKEQQTIVLDQ
ncbi:hypothetical protein DNTS_028962 [Danionella cerebrum]|uniref:Testicular haploid expressed gene protein-like n=1 Tax=Danionella cerebrum TaxID=2873325 RepID=A0A553QQA5_9TELE|nr:hypothetical protein DNTS_028962 [Danionella translucida]